MAAIRAIFDSMSRLREPFQTARKSRNMNRSERWAQGRVAVEVIADKDAEA
jgi:hypothetical protein